MLTTFVLGLALLLHAASAVTQPWVGDVFSPGERVSYAHPYGRLPDGDYSVTLADEAGRESSTPGTVSHHDLSFACPALHAGFYEIAEVRSVRSGRVYWGHINGAQGFYIQ